MAAFTVVGRGPWSVTVQERGLEHLPAPSLLVAGSSGISILDADLGDLALLHQGHALTWAAALLKNDSAMWMDINSDIFQISLKTRQIRRVCNKSIL